MAGTIEGITMCAMLLVTVIIVAVSRDDTVSWVVAAIGVVALCGHIAIMIREHKDPPSSDESL